MKFTQAFKMALSSIFSNRMRSFLTMLGIIIGITSVIVMIAIGQGSSKAVTDAIQSMGTNLLTVSFTGNQSATLSASEMKSLEENPSIKNIAPTVSGTATVKAGSNNSSTSILGSLPCYAEIRNINSAIGRFINQDDIDNRYKVAVVGQEVLQNIYPDIDPSDYSTLIGQHISINGTKVEIVGILASQGTSTAGSSDNQIILPLTTAERLLKNTTISTYYVEASSADDVNAATNSLNTFLLAKFDNDSTQFRVLSQSQMITARDSTANTMTLMLAGIAAISLIVGGIGIMNIMLVSVVERTREIGIRKAIGAKRKDILTQFLIEAIFLSCLGGIIGVLLGIALCLILPIVTSLTIVMQVPIMILSFGFAAGVGIIFGFYPANKASKLRPIEALRYE